MNRLSSSSPQWALVDIGLNLTDAMFFGTYHSHQRHPSDMTAVLQRAVEVGVRGLLITGGNLKESREAIQLCGTHSSDHLSCYCTVGCHPTRCSEFEKDPDMYLASLEQLIAKHSVHAGGCVAAIGEIGLDYDRLFFCPKETQLKYFEKQLEMAHRHQLPLFLHDRNTGGDFFAVLSRHRVDVKGGVVHSFTGTVEELQQYVAAGLYIGVNGCSLKTAENLEVVKAIPLDRLLIETDGPWCDIRDTHASRTLLREAAARYASGNSRSGELLAPYPTCRNDKFKKGAMVKGRQEPCKLVEVLEVIYELRRDEVESMEALAAVLLRNTNELFPFQYLQSSATLQ